jgi:hypothetical protein
LDVLLGVANDADARRGATAALAQWQSALERLVRAPFESQQSNFEADLLESDANFRVFLDCCCLFRVVRARV